MLASNKTSNKAMNKLFFLFTIILNSTLIAQISYPFQKGEQLEYKVHYGPVVAGKAKLKVNFKEGNYQFYAEGKSVGLFNLFFKVRDYYKSTLSKDCFCPLYFNREVNEGNYNKEENVFFNYSLQQAESTRDTIALPENTQDILSMFYYLRTLNQEEINLGEAIDLEVYLDDTFIKSNLVYLGKDTLKTKFGTIPSTKWSPQLETGRVFEEEYGMTVWISDDLNKIPLRIESKVLVGSIKMDLTNYKNLIKPLNIL
tara:strand:+ start:1662 stop:2429 length:768 start_codon:yes stop_codon:yes gene_type:complete